MPMLRGFLLAELPLSVEDLTSPTAYLVYLLAGLMLILWLLGVVLSRGGARKASRREGAFLAGTMQELKDLVDGLHESVGRVSDAVEFTRDKMDGRLNSTSRSLEALPRINEGVAKMRETLVALEKTVASPVESDLKVRLEEALAALRVKEGENAQLQKDVAEFHEALQAAALEAEQKTDDAAVQAKLRDLEASRQALEEEKAKFEKHQGVIKAQIKEAGEKLKQAKDEVRAEREALRREQTEGAGAGAGVSEEERRKLDEEWETLKEQQDTLQAEREWIDSEKAALEEERDALRSSLDAARNEREEMLAEVHALRDRVKSGPAGVELGPVWPKGVSPESDTAVDEGAGQDEEPAPAPAPGHGADDDRDLASWGYSSLTGADEPADIPAADEEDITAEAETASDEKSRDEWEDMIGTARENADIPGLREDAAPRPEPDLEGMPPLPDLPEAIPGLDTPLPAAEDPVADLVEAPEEDLPGVDAPGEWAEPAPAPVETQAAPPVEEEPDEDEEEVSFSERSPGIHVAAYAGILLVRLDFNEIKNPEAHALDEVIFSETSDKDDRILLNLDSVKYINSRGLSSITKIAVQRTANLVLTNENVLKIMDMMGFLPLFTIFNTEEDALEAFGETEV